VGTVKTSAGTCDTLRFSATSAKFLDALCPQNEFQSRHQLVLAIPRFRKNAQDGFDGRQQFFFRQKIRQYRGSVGKLPSPPPTSTLNPRREVPLLPDLRDKPDIMDSRNRAIAIVLAAEKAILNLRGKS